MSINYHLHGVDRFLFKKVNNFYKLKRKSF